MAWVVGCAPPIHWKDPGFRHSRDRRGRRLVLPSANSGHAVCMKQTPRPSRMPAAREALYAIPETGQSEGRSLWSPNAGLRMSFAI